MKKIITIILLSTALLSGCATFDRATHTTDPVMGDSKVNNTTKGVENAGTVAEAIVGGGTGYYMDNQEEILRGKLEKSGVRVLRQGNNINWGIHFAGVTTISCDSTVSFLLCF